MYYVVKRLEISAAHSLMLSYESKCEETHGHNFIIKIYCKSEKLNFDGMVTTIKISTTCFRSTRRPRISPAGSATTSTTPIASKSGSPRTTWPPTNGNSLECIV